MEIEELLELRGLSRAIQRCLVPDVRGFINAYQKIELSMVEIVRNLEGTQADARARIVHLDRYLDQFSKRYSGAIEQRLSGQLTAAWRTTREFYEELEDSTMLRLLDDLKSRGYDRRIRAGVSLFTLILSRAITHGLTGNEAAIMVNSSASNRHLNLGLKEGELSISSDFPGRAENDNDEEEEHAEAVVFVEDEPALPGQERTLIKTYPSTTLDDTIDRLLRQPWR